MPPKLKNKPPKQEPPTEAPKREKRPRTVIRSLDEVNARYRLARLRQRYPSAGMMELSTNGVPGKKWKFVWIS